MSRVTCHMSQFKFFYLIFFFGQSGEAQRWRVCYQRGLPRLVFQLISNKGVYRTAPASPGLLKKYLPLHMHY